MGTFKKFIFLLIILPGFSFAQGWGMERHTLDTLQIYKEGQEMYTFLLDGKSQGLYMGNILYDGGPPSFDVHIINNTKSVVKNNYRERDSRIIWLRRNGRYDSLMPGESMIVSCKWPDGRPRGNFSCPIDLRYQIGDSSYVNRIMVWGSIYPTRERLEPNTEISLQPSEKAKVPNLVLTKETPPKETPPKEASKYPSRRPDGVEWFGKGTIHHREVGVKTYAFRLENNHLHNFAKPRGVNDIFAWDTLTEKDLGQEYTFKFKNETDAPIYILELTTFSRNFHTKNIGKSILLPDSSATVLFIGEKNMQGHFYGNVSITYSNKGKINIYDLGLWGFQPDPVQSPNYSGRGQKSDTLAVYLVDSEQKTHQEYRLKVTQNSKVHYPKVQQVNGEYLYYIPKEFHDSIWYEVIDKNGKVMSKGLFTSANRDRNVFIGANNSRENIHTYMYGFGPIKYEAMYGVYFVKWENDFPRENVIAYLKTKGLELKFACEPYFSLKDPAQIIRLQKELLNSKYKIILHPVIRYSLVSKNGWGGGCEYYGNQFEIGFYIHVSDKRIKEIFKQLGITQYSGPYVDREGLKRCSFTYNSIIDPAYMKLLDELWDLPEVYKLGQLTANIPGLD